jgi:hypothetical protein
MNVQERIDKLERELADLKKAAGQKDVEDTKPTARTFEEPRGVQVRELLTERHDLPSLQDLRKLLAVVKPLVPRRRSNRSR